MVKSPTTTFLIIIIGLISRLNLIIINIRDYNTLTILLFKLLNKLFSKYIII